MDWLIKKQMYKPYLWIHLDLIVYFLTRPTMKVMPDNDDGPSLLLSKLNNKIKALVN